MRDGDDDRGTRGCIASASLWTLALAVVVPLGLAVARLPADAQTADLHAFWDSRCANCHRHAGEFSRNHFKLKDGRLVGRNPARDICAYLIGHGAGETRAAPVCAMLTAQAETPSLFKNNCASCHETAADLARTGLVQSDGGALKGKDNGRDIAEFLTTHGKLEAGEVAIVVETLKRVYREVHDAGK